MEVVGHVVADDNSVLPIGRWVGRMEELDCRNRYPLLYLRVSRIQLARGVAFTVVALQ